MKLINRRLSHIKWDMIFKINDGINCEDPSYMARLNVELIVDAVMLSEYKLINALDNHAIT